MAATPPPCSCDCCGQSWRSPPRRTHPRHAVPRRTPALPGHVAPRARRHVAPGASPETVTCRTCDARPVSGRGHADAGGLTGRGFASAPGHRVGTGGIGCDRVLANPGMGVQRRRLAASRECGKSVGGKRQAVNQSVGVWKEVLACAGGSVPSATASSRREFVIGGGEGRRKTVDLAGRSAARQRRWRSPRRCRRAGGRRASARAPHLDEHRPGHRRRAPGCRGSRT
jgi:hypothetical protein